MYSSQQKINKAYKETGKYEPFTGKKKKLTKTNPKEAHTLDILDEDFKLTVLNMLKELKETMGKQLNSRAKNTITKVKKFTEGVQQQI